MTTLRINFDGDASKLIAEHRKMLAELKAESAERRKNESESRRMAANERQRLKMKITEGKNAKRVFVDIGKAAADAMKSAKDPSDEYTKALFRQQQALDAGAISLDQFKQRKMELLRTLREAKAAQSGENDILKRAGILVEKAATATDVFEQKQRDLKTALSRGKITQEQYNAAMNAAQAELRETKDAQSGANQELRLAAQLVRQARDANDVYEDKVSALNLALKRGKITQEQHTRAVRNAKQELTAAGASNDKWNSSLKGTVGSLVGITSGAAAAAGAIALIRAEYDHLLQRQNVALDRTMTLAQAQEQAAGNLGNVPEMNTAQLFANVRAASLDLGVDEVGLTKAVSDALSARGNKSADDAVESVIAAAKLRRFSPEELPQLSAAALDISKGTGMQLEEALGFLMEVGTQSRITNLKSLSENVAPSLTSAGLYNVSPAFAGATSAALSQSIVDPTGQTTRTAVTKLFQQLEKFRPEDNVADTLAELQKDDALRAEFFAAKTEGGFAASFEAKALPSIQALLQAGSVESKQFRDALAKLNAVDGQARFDRQVADVNALPAVQTARIKQITENMGDQLAFADPSLAVSAAVREGLKELRDGMGEAQLSSRFGQLVEDFLSGGNRDVGELLENMNRAVERLTSPTVDLGSGGVGGAGQVRVREVTERDKRQAAVLEKTIGLLEQLQKIAEAPAPPLARPNPVPPPEPVAAEGAPLKRVFGDQPDQVAGIEVQGLDLTRQALLQVSQDQRPGDLLREQGAARVAAPERPDAPAAPVPPVDRPAEVAAAVEAPERPAEPVSRAVVGVDGSQSIVDAVDRNRTELSAVLREIRELIPSAGDLQEKKSESPVRNAKAAQVASVGRLARRKGNLG